MFKIDMLGGLNEAETVKQINSDIEKVQSKVKGFETGKVTGMTTQYKKLSDGTEQLVLKSVKLQNSLGQTAKVTLKTNGTIKTLSKNMTDAKKSVMGLGAQTVEAFKKFAVWGGVTTLYFSAIQAVKDMVKQIKDLDDALVELSKVTNLSKQELSDFGEEASKVGKQVNSTASDVIRASADFARMGFSSEKSLQLAKDVIVLTNIADGITDVTEASTAMIAILKGFNLEASQSKRIIDSINEVSNNFAINTDDLADGLRRVGGVMSQNGTTLEETIGLLVGAQQGLQNIEKVSSGLITISTRLRRVKEDTEDINGLTVSLADAFDTYTDGKVKLQNLDGSLRTTYEVLTDLSKVWGTLDDESKSYLGFLASGVRQSPVLNQMMQDMNSTVDATATAMTSAGSATEEFAKYAESLQGKLDALDSTWNRLATDFISSDTIGFFIDFANGIGLGIEELGGLDVAILSSTTALGVLLTEFNLVKNVMQELGIIERKTEIEELNSRLERLSELMSTGNDRQVAKATAEFDKLTKQLNLLIAEQEREETLLRESKAGQKWAEYTKYAKEHFNVLEDVIDNTSEATNKTSDLSDALHDLATEGSITDETLIGIANNQDIVNKVLGLSEDALIDLATQWQLSGKDMSLINEAITDKAIEESRLRLEAVLLEISTLQNVLSGEDNSLFATTSYGSTGYTDYLETLNVLLEQANTNRKEYEDIQIRSARDFSSGDGGDGGDDVPPPEIVESYTVALEDLILARQELAMTESLQGAQEKDMTDDIIAGKVKLKKEISALADQYRAILKEGNLTTEEIAEIEQILVDLAVEYNDINKDLNDQEKERLELLKDQTSFLEKQEELAKQSEQDAESMNDLLEATVDLIKQEKEDYKDALNDEKDKLKALEDEVDLRKELDEMNKDRADIEEELFILKLDGSEDNNARILELEDKLTKKKKEINEKLEDDKRDKQEQALDNSLQLIDDYLDKEGKIRADAINRINESFRSGTDTLMNQLIEWNNLYGTSIQSDIVNMWDSAGTALSRYASNLSSLNIGNSMLEAQMAMNSANWHLADTQAEKDSLHSANMVLGAQLGKSYDSSTGIWSQGGSGGIAPSSNSNTSLPSGAVKMPPSTIGSSPMMNNSSSSIANNLSITVNGGAVSDVGRQIESAGYKILNAMNNRGMKNTRTM